MRKKVAKLQNRHLVAFGGKFKEIHKKLNLDDSIDGDLIHTDNENKLRNDLSYTLNYMSVECRISKLYKNYWLLNFIFIYIFI